MNSFTTEAQRHREIVEQGSGTGPIIGAAIEVHRHLGPGLLESAYEECLCHEMHLAHPVHEAQLLTYMKLSGRHAGLLINFNVPVLRRGIVRSVL